MPPNSALLLAFTIKFLDCVLQLKDNHAKGALKMKFHRLPICINLFLQPLQSKDA